MPFKARRAALEAKYQDKWPCLASVHTNLHLESNYGILTVINEVGFIPTFCVIVEVTVLEGPIRDEE